VRLFRRRSTDGDEARRARDERRRDDAARAEREHEARVRAHHAAIEREEAERVAERRRVAEEEIRRTVEGAGVWWPGDTVVWAPGRLRGTNLRGRLLRGFGLLR
jgi:hypothetical protein